MFMLNQLHEELKQAMKKGDRDAMTGFRNIIGKLKAAQIDKGEALTDDESMKILKSSTKQLKESIDQYKIGGREDLAEKELFELSLIEKYLPEQLSEDKIQKVVEKVIQATGAESIQEMGRVMGIVMKELKGAADGKLVQKIVQNALV